MGAKGYGGALLAPHKLAQNITSELIILQPLYMKLTGDPKKHGGGGGGGGGLKPPSHPLAYWPV